MKSCLRPPLFGLLALLILAQPESWAQDAAPPAAASAPPPAASAPADERAAAQPIFDILAFDIEGNTLLDGARVERAVLPFMGPGRKMDDVEAARSALEQQFQQAGYLTVGVDIPEQRVEDGLVRLVVVQGRVGALYVSGSKYHAQGWIRERVAEFAPGQVPDFNRAQQQLALVNRSDDRRVQPILKPGRLPGTVDIDLQVDDHLPLSGTLEFNNQHALGTEPIKAIATLRYDNLHQRDHGLSLMVQGAPLKTSESQVVMLGYSEPLDNGDSLSLSVLHSNSDIASLGGTQVLGKGTTWGLRRSVALGENGQGPVLSLGFDYKRLSERARFDQAEIFATPLNYLPFQLGWSQGWADGPQRAQLSGNLVFAMRRLFERQVDCIHADGNQGRDDQFACKRRGGDGSFGALRLDGRWSLAPDPVGIALRLAVQGASGPLASAEQFSLGGADTVRGYLEGEAAGDQGWLGSIELRGPNLVPLLVVEGWRDLNLLAFIDGGRADTFQAATGQASQVPLGSAGLGLRGLGSSSAGGLEGALDFAWPLRATANTALRDLHLHARLQARF